MGTERPKTKWINNMETELQGLEEGPEADIHLESVTYTFFGVALSNTEKGTELENAEP